MHLRTFICLLETCKQSQNENWKEFLFKKGNVYLKESFSLSEHQRQKMQWMYAMN